MRPDLEFCSAVGAPACWYRGCGASWRRAVMGTAGGESAAPALGADRLFCAPRSCPVAGTRASMAYYTVNGTVPGGAGNGRPGSTAVPGPSHAVHTASPQAGPGASVQERGRVSAHRESGLLAVSRAANQTIANTPSGGCSLGRLHAAASCTCAQPCTKSARTWNASPIAVPASTTSTAIVAPPSSTPTPPLVPLCTRAQKP